MASQTKVCSMGFARHKAPKVRRHKGFVKAAAIKQSQTAPPKKKPMTKGQWLKVFRFPLSAFRYLLKEKRSPKAPQFLLVNQSVLFRAEAWEGSACATTDDWFAYVVATLGYNLVNINLWSRIAQNIFLHNTFEFYLIFVIARLEEPWQSSLLFLIIKRKITTLVPLARNDD